MNAVDLHSDVIDKLGRGNWVFVAEAMKGAAVDTGNAIENAADSDGNEDERTEALLARASGPSELLLAGLLPTIEYGDPRLLGVVPRCLTHITSRTSAARQEVDWNRRAGVVVAGRLVWALAAYALSCNRLDALAEAARAVVRVPFKDNETQAVVTLTPLRYPDPLGGGAVRSFENYRDWLKERPLVQERYPLFTADFEAAFAEADFLLALRAGRDRSRLYSMGFDQDTVARFVARCSDAPQRDALARLFAASDDSLNDVLESAYTGLETDRHGWERPPEKLFGAS